MRDSKNIFGDVINVETLGLHTEELRQAAVNLKWVDGEQELADPLTKPWKHDALAQALSRGEWRVVYDAEFQSARLPGEKRALKQLASSEHFWLQVLWAVDFRFDVNGGQKEFLGRCETEHA